ncbi:hypothetical protein HY483_00795 [Candidatus Woesearchaeota archaeon]|nr:hypothetical protein [Candidatus Woesearchaeota archaeon]
MKKFFAIFVLLMFLNTALAAELDNKDVIPRKIGRDDDRARAFDEGPDDFKRGPEGFGPGPSDDFGSFDGPPDDDFGQSGRGPRGFDKGPGGPERERFKAREDYGPRIPDFSKHPDGIYGMAFQYIDDEISEEEIFPLCGEPEKIADLLVGKIKENIGGDVSTVCNEFPVAECAQRVEEGCGRIGKPPEEFFDGASELEKKEMTAHSCPVPSEETFVELCKERSKQWLETRREVISDQEFCEQEFDRHQPRDFQDESSERTQRVERVERRAESTVERSDTNQESVSNEVSPTETASRTQGSTGSETTSPTTNTGSSSPSTGATTSGGSTESTGSGSSAGTGTSANTNSASTSPDGVTGSAITEQRTLGQSLLRIITGAAVGLGLVEDSHSSDGHSGPPSGGDSSGGGSGSSSESASGSTVSGDATSTGGDSSGGSTGGEGLGRVPQDNFRQDNFRQDQISPEDKEKFDRESRASREDFERKNQREPPREEFRDDTRREDFRQEPSDFERFESERRGPSKDEMLQECIKRQKEDAENPTHCKVEAKIEAKRQTQMCTRFEKEQKNCKEKNAQMCKKLEEVQTLCKEKMNEQSLREFILKEAKRRCAFVEVQDELSGPEESLGYIALVTLSEDSTVKDIEGLEIAMDATLDRYRAIRDSIVYGAKYESKDVATKAGQLAAKFSGSVVLGVDVVKDFREGESVKQKDLRKRLLLAAQRLEEAKGGDFEGIAQTQDLVEAAQELKSQEEGKGTFYRFLKFFGAKKEQELREATTLEEKNAKIDELIKELESEIADEQDPVLATILGEEIETLKEQKGELNAHIEEKKDDAGGLFG